MKLWCKYKRLTPNSIIQILTSPNSYSIESWLYNDIDCQFAICETSFWSATVFKSEEQHDTNNNNSGKGICHICPTYAGDNISVITIATDIFRK
jgi:hypothetical protein